MLLANMPELKRKLVPLQGIAFVVAIVATGVFYGLFVGELKSATTLMSNQTILVAARDLPRGKQLESSDLKVSRWAGAESLKGTFTRPEQVTGQPLLFNVSQNEPITESKLTASANAAPLVPAGMRAVSVRIQESSGLMPFLKPGNRVDIQMVSSLNALRTILENVEVLSISSPASNVPGSLVSILTLLVTPNEADRVALADATAKLRLLLRNPTDKDASGRTAIELSRVLQETHLQPAQFTSASTSTATQTSSSQPNAVVTQPSNRIDFEVRVMSASDQGMEALNAKLIAPRIPGQLSVSAFRQGSNAQAMVRQLVDTKQLEILSTTSYVSVNDRQISVHPGTTWNPSPGLACGLFLNLQPTTNGKSIRLRVQPEVTVPHGPEVESRRISTELNFEDPSSFAVTGWTMKNQAQTLLEKLFPTQWTNKENRDLVVVVTPSWPSTQQHLASNSSSQPTAPIKP